MDTLQRTVPVPQHEIIMHRALRWQVFRQGAPLATGLQNIENPIHHLAHIHLAPTAATLGRWDQWRDQRPLRIAQIAGIASAFALVETTVFARPHRPPPASRIGGQNRITNDSNQSTSFRTDTKSLSGKFSCVTKLLSDWDLRIPLSAHGSEPSPSGRSACNPSRAAPIGKSIGCPAENRM